MFKAPTRPTTWYDWHLQLGMFGSVRSILISLWILSLFLPLSTCESPSGTPKASASFMVGSWITVHNMVGGCNPSQTYVDRYGQVYKKKHV